jgi:hypothetical protein
MHSMRSDIILITENAELLINVFVLFTPLLLFLTNSTALAKLRHHPEINPAPNKTP